MIIPGQILRYEKPIHPFEERTVSHGMTYGLGPAGYDVRIKESFLLEPSEFRLASTIERFHMPTDMQAVVHDKSTWARKGLSLFNTIIDPGWSGYLTLELSNRGSEILFIESGMPIAQIIFHRLEAATMQPYNGKYQDQPSEPVPAILEK